MPVRQGADNGGRTEQEGQIQENRYREEAEREHQQQRLHRVATDAESALHTTRGCKAVRAGASSPTNESSDCRESSAVSDARPGGLGEGGVPPRKE